MLVLLCLAVYVPGLRSLPAVDRDEARFAQASRQMFEAAAWPESRLDRRMGESGAPLGPHAGGWAVPMVENRPRLNKPPLIYWLQVAGAWACTGGEPALDAIWMYRLPSVVAAMACVLMCWRWGLELFGGRAGWLAAAMLALSPVFVWEAKQARADMVLVAFTLLACWMLWRVWRGHRHGRGVGWSVWLMWVAVGLGVLTKGPMTPLVVAGGALALCVVSGSGRFLWRVRPISGVAIVIAIALPWVWITGERIGWEAYAAIVMKEVVGRSVEAAEGHSGPPGYYLLVLLPTLGPGVLFAAAGLARGFSRGMPGGAASGGSGWSRVRARVGRIRAGRDAELFLVCTIVPAWWVLEVVSTKLPHYTMALYPPVLLLASRAALAWRWRQRGWLGARPGLVMVHASNAGVLGLVGAAAGVGLLAGLGGTGPGRLIGGACVGAGVSLSLYYVWRALGRVRGQDWLGLLRLNMLTMGIAAVGLLVALPRVRGAWVVHGLCGTLTRLEAGRARPIAFVKLHEDSSVFELRGRAEWIDEYELKGWLRANPGGLVVLPPGAESRWPPLGRLGGVTGFNYSKGELGEWVIVEQTREIPGPAWERGVAP